MSKTPAEVLSVTPEQRNKTGMLIALGRKGKHVYEGTVGAAEKTRRRAKNKRARAARRGQR